MIREPFTPEQIDQAIDRMNDMCGGPEEIGRIASALDTFLAKLVPGNPFKALVCLAMAIKRIEIQGERMRGNDSWTQARKLMFAAYDHLHAVGPPPPEGSS